MKAVLFEQIEKPKRAGDCVWLCGYGYSKIVRDKVQIQAKPRLLVEKDFLPRISVVHYVIDGSGSGILNTSGRATRTVGTTQIFNCQQEI
jgi:hypothetical protein